MKLILLKDSTSEVKSLCLSGKRFFGLIVVLAVALPAAVGVGGFWFGQKVSTADGLQFANGDAGKLQQALLSQRDQLNETNEYVKNHLNALGMKMGSLQAQVSRINAVEQRLAEAAGIDLESFRFEQDPGQGGADATDGNVVEADLNTVMSDLERELRAREAEIESLGMMMSALTLKSEQTPSGMPVKNGWISSKFGYRNSPIHGGRQFHKGVDIPGKVNQDVIAVADGVVLRSEKSGNYGWLVEINHGDGITTLYAHNNSNTVKVGEPIKKGQLIAKLGSTGRSTGPHVHFEVRKNGKMINPSKFIR